MTPRKNRIAMAEPAADPEAVAEPAADVFIETPAPAAPIICPHCKAPAVYDKLRTHVCAQCRIDRL